MASVAMFLVPDGIAIEVPNHNGISSRRAHIRPVYEQVDLPYVPQASVLLGDASPNWVEREVYGASDPSAGDPSKPSVSEVLNLKRFANKKSKTFVGIGTDPVVGEAELIPDARQIRLGAFLNNIDVGTEF